MSKVSFRARALDVTKPMPVYISSDIPDIPDFATINRSVPIMPTGMEKEEETEHHLQRALSAQQVYGTSETLVIPIPEIVTDHEQYNKLYLGEYKQPKQYVHMQAFGMDQEIPDYDMDSDDESWIKEQGRRVDITPAKFEEMMDRLEKGSGQQVVTLHEAKALLKEDDDLIIAVYDYWLNKRLHTKHPLILQWKSEKRDGSTTNNPYVAFRRRSEKMQTRKNRKNDEVSYERMLKLRRDINRALTVIEMMKRREKAKKEMLQLTIEILQKRNSMGDFSGDHLAAAEKERLSKPVIPHIPLAAHWPRPTTEKVPNRKKREYKKRRVKPPTATTSINKKLPHIITSSSHYNKIEVVQPEYGSDYDSQRTVSPVEREEENDPDGAFSFRRRSSCTYQAPLHSLGHFSWDTRDGGDIRHRYSLLSLPPPYKCVGYGRRRVGRGGRILVDRAETDWDDTLCSLDVMDESSAKSTTSDYVVYIRDRKIKHFRPRSPPPPPSPSPHTHHSHHTYTTLSSHYGDKYQSQRQELIRIRQLHQQVLLRDSSYDSMSTLTPSHSSRSRVQLDANAARFAASALIDNKQLQKSLEIARKSLTPKIAVIGSSSLFTTMPSPLVTGSTTAVNMSSFLSSTIPNVPTVSLVNGPSLTERCTVHPSTSGPTVLQLNFTPNPLGSTADLTQLAKANKTQIITHSNSLLKLTPANGTNASLLKSNHDETLPIRALSNDTPIPMDVT